MQADILLALGSNLGDKQENLEKACRLLEDKINIIRRSAFYTTKPYGVTDQPEFLNGALYGKTGLSPMELLKFVKETEKACGRVETFRWGPRVIDIDIVFYDNIIYNSVALTIPHRDLHNREFVKKPALEIIPETDRLFWKRYIKEQQRHGI